ncbi:hypothetical protein KAZ01_02065 [Candidatus Gracilibacteria bacterium]|nr:hypothetical protein [Candidatus Gracilibacteria bacterium]
MEQTICVFGDSIVWGAWDIEKGGWVSRLRNYFESNNYDIRFYNCGICGENTDDLLKRFKVEANSREPTIIIFAIGINDSQYINSKNNPRVTIKKFQNNLQELISQAKNFTNQIIFIGLSKVNESKTTPISRNIIKFYDNENIKLYDSKIKEICRKNNLQFIEIFDLLDNKDIDGDGLHPNSSGHEKMFLRVKDFLLSILNS